MFRYATDSTYGNAEIRLNSRPREHDQSTRRVLQEWIRLAADTVTVSLTTSSRTDLCHGSRLVLFN